MLGFLLNFVLFNHLTKNIAPLILEVQVRPCSLLSVLRVAGHHIIISGFLLFFCIYMQFRKGSLVQSIFKPKRFYIFDIPVAVQIKFFTLGFEIDFAMKWNYKLCLI